jgi:hypothetical protein
MQKQMEGNQPLIPQNAIAIPGIPGIPVVPGVS